MQVYRISLAKWTNKLNASGNKARWSKKGSYVIYTASTRALACLENVVHRAGEGLRQLFKVIVIDVPDDILIEEIYLDNLQDGWNKSDDSTYEICQAIGGNWLERAESAILKVPSSIIQKESNYLLNINHPDFKRIKIIELEDFEFDLRIKEN
jgi:RES domain-containing protein